MLTRLGNIARMDELIRIAAFEWLEKQASLYDDVLPRKVLEEGFYYQNQRIVLIGAKGIWKPKTLQLPISITTTADSPYDDAFTKENFLKYRYRGTDPYHPDNVGLREIMRKQIPLIYFHGIVKGKYLATWPVYIIHDSIQELTFTVAVDEVRLVKTDMVHEDPETYYRRSYLTSNIKLRLHQRSFRERVLLAYQNQCTFCKLKHIELLDAAHIIPDSEEHGQPVVQNGLSLCKIHHATFDKNIIGITPDFTIKVRKDILGETNGPMLKFGIQSLDNNKIILPRHKSDWPDRERLEERYQQFKSA